MTVISGLVRRAAAEAERHLRGGLDHLARLGRDLERTAGLRSLPPAHEERIRRLEEALAGQDAGLAAVRAELDSLVVQLNDRLLPRIDERMDDNERDLAGLATGLIRTGKDTAANRGHLETLDRRFTDLRGKLAQMEQRAGLWRDLQATMARLGDDIDALRSRVENRTDHPLPVPAPGPAEHAAGHAAEATDLAGERADGRAAAESVKERLSGHLIERVAEHAADRVPGHAGKHAAERAVERVAGRVPERVGERPGDGASFGTGSGGDPRL